MQEIFGSVPAACSDCGHERSGGGIFDSGEEEDLRLGDIYFVLPISILDSDLSPQNLAALAARLVAAAKKEGSKHVQGSHGDSNLGHLSAVQIMAAPPSYYPGNRVCSLSMPFPLSIVQIIFKRFWLDLPAYLVGIQSEHFLWYN
ncbi:hypothetical protein SUGI_0102490 [Cryptomeria japonica]|nr:hypothetical protein SUGI_0102490 [Cryptomeria japonica]